MAETQVEGELGELMAIDWKELSSAQDLEAEVAYG